MIRDIVKYERAGKSYIAFDRSGRPVGIITEVKSINTPSRRPDRSNDAIERLAR